MEKILVKFLKNLYPYNIWDEVEIREAQATILEKDGAVEFIAKNKSMANKKIVEKKEVKQEEVE